MMTMRTKSTTLFSALAVLAICATASASVSVGVPSIAGACDITFLQKDSELIRRDFRLHFSFVTMFGPWQDCAFEAVVQQPWRINLLEPCL